MIICGTRKDSIRENWKRWNAWKENWIENAFELWNGLSKIDETTRWNVEIKDKFPPKLTTKFTENKSEVGRRKKKGKARKSENSIVIVILFS